MNSFAVRQRGAYSVLEVATGPRVLDAGFIGASGNFSNHQLKSEQLFIPAQLGVETLFVLEQVHGSDVLEISPSMLAGSAQHPPIHSLGAADALLLHPGSYRGMAFGIRAADCLNVLAESGSWRALIHAGWRGLAAGIMSKALQALTSRSGLPVTAWSGPAARACCYEVGPDVLEALAPHAVVASHGVVSGDQPRDGSAAQRRLALLETAQHQVSAAGLSVRWVDSGVCTICDSGWHSHRRSGAAAGRNLAFFSQAARVES